MTCTYLFRLDQYDNNQNAKALLQLRKDDDDIFVEMWTNIADDWLAITRWLSNNYIIIDGTEINMDKHIYPRSNDTYARKSRELRSFRYCPIKIKMGYYCTECQKGIANMIPSLKGQLTIICPYLKDELVIYKKTIFIITLKNANLFNVCSEFRYDNISSYFKRKQYTPVRFSDISSRPGYKKFRSDSH